MNRREAESIILGALYGFPGEEHDTRTGQDLLLVLLDEMGLKALTDDAVTLLAEKHSAIDNRKAAS